MQPKHLGCAISPSRKISCLDTLTTRRDTKLLCSATLCNLISIYSKTVM